MPAVQDNPCFLYVKCCCQYIQLYWTNEGDAGEETLYGFCRKVSSLSRDKALPLLCCAFLGPSTCTTQHASTSS